MSRTSRVILLVCRTWLWVIRVFANVVVFLSLAGTSYAIYLAVDNAESNVHNRDFHKAFNGGAEGFKLFMASFQVTTKPWMYTIYDGHGFSGSLSPVMGPGSLVPYHQ